MKINTITLSSASLSSLFNGSTYTLINSSSLNSVYFINSLVWKLQYSSSIYNAPFGSYFNFSLLSGSFSSSLFTVDGPNLNNTTNSLILALDNTSIPIPPSYSLVLQYSGSAPTTGNSALQLDIYTNGLDIIDTNPKFVFENEVDITGGLIVSGSVDTISGSLIYSDRKVVDWNNQQLNDTSNKTSLDWKNRILYDSTQNTALSYTSTGSSNGVRLYGTASYALTASVPAGGANTQIQFNSASVFSGSNKLTYDYVNSNLSLSGSFYLSQSQYFNPIDNNITTTGQVGWDTGNETLAIGLSGSSGNIPVLDIGAQSISRVYNAQGSTITKGQVVYISGSQGNRIAVKLASAVGDPTSAGTLGFVLDDIATGAEGYVLTEGVLNKINTTGLTAGALLFLSSSAGSYTQTVPVPPIHRVTLGYVERVDAVVGSIYVKIDNGYEIDELHNVKISSPSSSGDLLRLSGSLWINTKQLTGSYGLTGSLSFTGGGVTGSVFGTSSWATNAISSSRPIAVTGSTIYSTSPLSTNSPNTNNNIFLGDNAGLDADNATYSNFLGSNAGGFANQSAHSNFLGQQAGYLATYANQSNFIGRFAGTTAIRANNSNFMGLSAGESATSASYSNFIGFQAGKSFLTYVIGSPSVDITNLQSFDYDQGSLSVVSATTSTIVVSGDYSANTQPFTFTMFTIDDGSNSFAVDLTYYTPPTVTSISYDNGLNESTFTFSPVLESTYYTITTTYPGTDRNNIIIGTNVGLPNGTRDSINIGGLIFGTGSYYNDTSPYNFTGSAGGRIGINKVSPQYTLDVSGSGNYTNGLTITGSLTIITGSAIELQVTNTGVTIGNIVTDTHTIKGITTISGSFTFTQPASPAFNGEIVRFGSGTLTTGQLYFYSSSGTWSLANANSTGSSTRMLGIAVGSSPTTNGLLIRGYAVSSSYNYGTGSIVYMATSSGIMTAASPSSSNHVVRVMGYQVSANTIYFDPDKTWVTLA